MNNDQGIAGISGLGEPRELGGNQRLTLPSSDQIWIVESGRVDIFIVEAKDNGLTGARRHFKTLAVGDGIPGLSIPMEDGRNPLNLLAVASEPTTLRQVSVDRLLNAPETGPLVLDRVLEQLLGSMADRRHRQINSVVKAGDSVVARPGSKYGSPGAPLWCVMNVPGTVAGIPISPVDQPRAIPLAGGSGLDVHRKTQLEFVDTRELATRGALPEAWNSFTGLLADFIRAHVLEQIDAETAQLRAKTDEGRRDRSRVLRDLLSIVVPQDHAILVAGGDDALLDACRIVGDATGVRIKAPPRWTAERQTADPLSAILTASRIRSRKVALRGRWWTQDAGPLLAFKGEEGSPVALLHERGHYEVVDPQTGDRSRVDEALRDSLSPFGYTFYRTLPDHPIGIMGLFRFGFEGLGWSFGSVVLLALAAGVLGVLMPLATGFVFSSVIPSARPDQLLQLFIGLSVAVISGVAFELTRSFVVLRLESRGGTAMQAALFDRLLKLPARFFRRFSVGDLVSRVSGIEKVQRMLSGSAVSAILGGLTGSFNLALLFWFDWRLALFALIWVGFALTVVGTLGWMAVRTQSEVQEHNGRLSGFVLQLINGIPKVRLSGAEDRALAQWGQRYIPKVQLERKAARIQAGVTVFNDLLPLTTSLVLFSGVGFLVSRGYGIIHTASFIAFNAALGTFMALAISTSNTILNLVNVVPLLKRAKPILIESPEVELEMPDPGELTGRIEGRHLGFRYDEDGPLILSDVSFEADPGDFVAFVGPSGSGKSTALRLLLGFETPHSGGVYFDGQELGSVDVNSARQQMGVVLQTSRLMAGDIFTNIVGSAPLSMDDAWEAAEMSGLADDIRDMPMGMQTILSEGGGTFSGGQRQRLLIARALANRPKIILFDEATSALDNRTQAQVSRSLEEIHATRIVIAHRLSTIQKATRIHVMVKGEIVEVGDYDELMTMGGVFTQLALRQLA